MGKEKQKRCHQKRQNQFFDYIIIGAGTAGGIIAKELTMIGKLLYWY